MIDISKLTPEEIKQAVDAAIIDYIEGRSTLERLVKRVDPYDDNDVFNILDKSLHGELISLLDMIGYVPYDDYHGPEYIKEVLTEYYNKLKEKKS